MTCVRAGCPFIVLGQMWSGTRKMRLTNGMAGFQSLPFLTNQKIISVIFWLVHIIQSDSCISSQSNLIGAESCDLIGRKSSIFIGWWDQTGGTLPTSSASCSSLNQGLINIDLTPRTQWRPKTPYTRETGRPHKPTQRAHDVVIASLRTS